jgi:alpha-glucosidase (family GH31 glycosyl hydrolase)
MKSVAVLLAALAVVLLGACARQETAAPQPSATQDMAQLQPDPSLSPQEVVRIQVEAMQQNDAPEPDSGIRIAFRFASPANKATTGPIERFIALVKNPQYRALLNSRSIEYGETEMMGSEAAQPVFIEGANGERVAYLFVLSRQTDEPFVDCWMTDAVLRLDSPDQPPQQEA